MRKDLNKQLCERQRRGHDMHYGEWRHSRAHDAKFEYDLDDEPFEGVGSGHRESMKHRYGWDTKSFNENLRPLYGFIRKSVGRVWDDVYSEICSVFDKRSVINQHILDHLFRYVETKNIYVAEDGELWVQATEYWRGPREDKPLRATSIEYYVDPRDGILKYNKHYRTWRQEWREHQKEKAEQQARIKRVVDKDTELRKIDGHWFEVKFEDVSGESVTKEVMSPWQKRPCLVSQTVFPVRFDVLQRCHVSEPRVAVSKRQLSSREIRQHGLTN